MDASINQSVLSTAPSEQPFQMITRVLSNVVDMQQNMISNFSNISTQIESLRVELRTTLVELRQDIGRLEDRSDKHIGDMRDSHDKEMERMMHLLEVLSIKSAPSGQPTASSQQQAQQAAAMQQAALMQQQQQQMQMFQQQAAAAAYMMSNPMMSAQRMNAGMTATSSAFGGMMATPSAQPTASTVTPSVPSSTVHATPSAPVQPSTAVVASQPVSTGVTSSPAVVSVPVNTVTPSKPLFSFGSTTPSATVSTPKTAISAAPVVVPTNPAAIGVAKPASSASAFGGFFQKPAATASPVSAVVPAPVPVNKVEEEDGEEHGEPEEYEPSVDFKPVIPLPDLVDVVTGEESEKVLFESRCKVYRFHNKEWKERGVGIMKILEHPDTKKTRIVMRREQALFVPHPNEWHLEVHKVCVNHYLDSQMTISYMKNKTTALMWMCMDASDGEPELSQLSVRFANEDLASEFKKVFEEAVTKCPGSSPSKSEVSVLPADTPKAVKQEIKEEVVIPKIEPVAAVKEEKKGGFDWKPASGSWDCAACYANNKADLVKCACCGTGKDGKAAEPELPKTVFSSAPSGTFSFGLSAAGAKPSTTVAPAVTTTPSTNSTPSTTKPTATTFSFGKPILKEENKPAVAPTFSFGQKSSPTSTTSTPSGDTKMSFMAAATAAAKEEPQKPVAANPVKFSFGSASPLVSTAAPAGSTPSPLTFSFKGSPKPNTSLFGGSASPSVFGGNASGTPESTDKKNEEPAKVFGSGSIFGGGTKPSFSFGSPKPASGNIFEGSDAEKAKEAFQALKKAEPLGAKPVFHAAAEGDGEEEGADEEYEPDVDFKPVVPLPELIDVVTGEEGEEVVFKERGKLYRYDKDTKDTKERGLGDIKILKDSEGQYRVVMRREQVHKLCANFRLSKDMKCCPKSGNPCVYSFWCLDCSEDVNGVTETFFVKFKTEDIAKKWQTCFEEGVAAAS